MAEDRVVDATAEDASRRGIFEHLKILLLVETYEREALADIADKEKSLVAARTPRGDSHAGKGAVDFGEAVQAAARVAFLATDKKFEARLVVRMLNVERGDQHGGIEERFHLVSPAF